MGYSAARAGSGVGDAATDGAEVAVGASWVVGVGVGDAGMPPWQATTISANARNTAIRIRWCRLACPFMRLPFSVQHVAVTSS